MLCCTAAFWLNSINSASGDVEEADVQHAPRIVKNEPSAGATDVSAGIAEITVTFDQNMLPGYSWMNGPAFPEVTGKPVWRGKRTCVLPVKLQRGRFYRLGINSSDEQFQNFTNEHGVPVAPGVLCFVTAGASETEKAKAIAPRVMATIPANDSKDVDPATSAIEVVFDKPMSSGMSWTGYGKKYPMGSAPAYWKNDRRTCVFPVRLQAGHEYEIGVNDLYDVNFQSADGVPAVRSVLRFKTRGAASHEEPPHK